jgi:hypothetical protein
MNTYPDPALLHPGSIAPDIHQRNAQIAKAMAALPEWWVMAQQIQFIGSQLK